MTTTALLLDTPLSRRDLTELVAAVCELPAGITGSAALATLTGVVAALTDNDLHTSDTDRGV